VADGAFGSEAPFVHFFIVNMGPTLCTKLNGVLSSHPEKASGAPAASSLFVQVECYQMEMRILDVVSSLVVYCEDVARPSLRQGLGKRAGKF
jgi:hypothetical protein